MRRADVFKLIVGGISLVNPPVGGAIVGIAAGVEHLKHRDDDDRYQSFRAPGNDDETADALVDIVMNVATGSENVTSQDYLKSKLLRQVAAQIRGLITFTQGLKLKTPAAPPPTPEP